MTSPAAKNLIGAHTSIAGGVHKALYEGQSIGANTIQMFTANQKRWDNKDLTAEAIQLWEKAQEETGITTVMSHDSYLINLGSPDPELREKSFIAFQRELQRCHQLNITYLNFHPGAATTASTEECLEQIVKSLERLAPIAEQGETTLLLETTAGQGSSVGHRFEHLAYILEKTKGKLRLGVCIDTCHIFAAGYDIRTKEGWFTVLQEFDRTIGRHYLQAFHINDSKCPFGSRKDRHASLGAGEMGIDCFKALMEIKELQTIPKYLETPDGLERWRVEIAMLKTFAKELVL